ncbi:MAG TPA: condensation domain-containing protein, partial [Pyrinomonadaceae bacterium]
MRADVIEDIYPLSPMQQGMLFHSVYAAGSGVYFEQMSCELRGELNLSAFGRAWQGVVDRHAVLRSSFVWEELDEPVQVVERRVEMPVAVLDWRALTAREQAARLEEFLVADREAGFNLPEAPLMRVTLMRLGADRHRLVWSHHHLLLDGWSMPLLLREVFSLYEAHARGESPYLPPPRPFRDYIAWLQRQDAARAERFWREYLRGFTAPTPLPLARASSQAGVESPRRGHGERRASLSREATEKLSRLARTHQLTLNTVVQGAWAVLLSRYSGEGEVVFGATVSGRPAELEGVERMLGLFINTLPVRARVAGEEKVCEWLRGLQEEGAEARQYEYAPLSDVQRWGGIGGGRPLFDSIFVFENYPVDSELGEGVSDGGASIEIGDVGSFKLTNYPLTLLAAVGGELRLLLSYDQSVFADESIEQLLRHLLTLLEAMAENPERRLAELSPLTEEERRRLVLGCNDTARDYPAGESIHGLFERQVSRTPDSIALTFGGESLTYSELNARANQLAHYLRRRGVGAESRVAVMLERSVGLVVSLLAVLKAGGAYVPLDPEYPAERLRFMLDDCRPEALVTDSSLSARLASGWGGRAVLLDRDGEAVAAESAADPCLTPDPQGLAYVIYTSGSTGRPKGAMNAHRGVVNRLLWMQEEYGLTASDVVMQKTPFSFDVSVWEFFWPLITGARLV